MGVFVDLKRGSAGITAAGEDIYRRVQEVASGQMTKAEIMGYVTSTDIWIIGPVI